MTNILFSSTKTNIAKLKSCDPLSVTVLARSIYVIVYAAAAVLIDSKAARPPQYRLQSGEWRHRS